MLKKAKAVAKIIDGQLILSLPNALKPVVWQMNFADYKAAALEVVEKDSQHILTLKAPNEDVVEVAPFATQADAVDSLMAVSSALEKGGAAHVSGGGTSFLKKLLTPILAILFLFVLLILATSFVPVAPTSLPTAGNDVHGGPAPVQSGVPMSADDFLNR